MKSDNWKGCFGLFIAGLFFIVPSDSQASSDYTFELEEIEKKSLQWGGYVDLSYAHLENNQEGALAKLTFDDHFPSSIDRFSSSLQMNGSYMKGISSFNWLLKASAQQDTFGWIDSADIYEAYGRVKPSAYVNIDLGKQSYKWGKGYAWNPVGFINRPKDPNDPQEALEGYVTGELDLIKSFDGSLGNVALTTVILPVYDGVNDTFGATEAINLAAKLYLLYLDTDIDLLLYTGNSRSTRIGADFSRNITTNFEIHGEAAYISSKQKFLFLDEETTRLEENDVFSGLLGLRYLTENDLTAIVEYYFNGNGYTEEERALFYQHISRGTIELDSSGSDTLLQQARELSLRGYGGPYVGRNYLYAKFTQKEPFDILYFTPGLTAIVNLDDQSASISPEFVYNGITNWELRLRFSLLTGGSLTEYGEKLISNKVELRLRWFF